jgi:LAO/AO transport system kinase
MLEPGAGDELTGIKRGLNEWADVVAVTKADGARAELARRTSAEFDAAFQLLRGSDAPRVVTVSAHGGAGVAELWGALEERQQALSASGELERRRALQRTAELHRRLSRALLRQFLQQPGRAAQLAAAEERVASGAELAGDAVRRLLGAP